MLHCEDVYQELICFTVQMFTKSLSVVLCRCLPRANLLHCEDVYQQLICCTVKMFTKN